MNTKNTVRVTLILLWVSVIAGCGTDPIRDKSMRLARVAGSYATQPKELEELLRRRIDPVKEPDLYAFSQVVLGMSRKEAEKILGRPYEESVTWENTTYELLPLLQDHPMMMDENLPTQLQLDQMPDIYGLPPGLPHVCMTNDGNIFEWLNGTECDEPRTAVTRASYGEKRRDYSGIGITYVFDVVVGRSFSYPDGTLGSR